LHFGRRSFGKHLAIATMMAGALAFAFQCIFVVSSEAATGDSSHYYLGFIYSHHDGHEHHNHVITHKHADGTVHHHDIDDDDGALANHVKQPGWNMALVTGVLPCPKVMAISDTPGQKLTIEKPNRLQIADLNQLSRPPRTPCIA